MKKLKLLFKHEYYMFIFLTLLTSKIDLLAQIQPSGGYWSGVGDVNLTIVTSDADNTDGLNDGAIFVDGQSVVVGQGVTFTFEGTMINGEVLDLNTYTYNVNNSYVRFDVELFNKTDGTVLTTTNVFISGNDTVPVNTVLNYTAGSQDVGDSLQLRYIRTDPGDTYRNFAIDNAKLNGSFLHMQLVTCLFTVTPDITLVPSDSTKEAEISLAVSRYSDSYLGTSAPSTTSLNAAISDYNNLNISVVGGSISGNPINNFNDVDFLKTFSQQLKFNPNDTVVEANGYKHCLVDFRTIL